MDEEKHVMDEENPIMRTIRWGQDLGLDWVLDMTWIDAVLGALRMITQQQIEITMLRKEVERLTSENIQLRSGVIYWSDIAMTATEKDDY